MAITEVNSYTAYVNYNAAGKKKHLVCNFKNEGERIRPINISDYHIYMQNDIKLHRDNIKSQGNDKQDKKISQRDTLELSQLSENRETIMNRMKHTVAKSVTQFNDTRAEILKKIREEKGYYDHSDIVNAVEQSYAKLYSEIEKRHENKEQQYYDIDGTILTKEDEIEWLDMQYKQEVEWQKSCAKTAAPVMRNPGSRFDYSI